jgi:hypothetical protein
MFRWTEKFQIQISYGVRDTKKRSCLWEKKNTSTDLKACVNSLDRGDSWDGAYKIHTLYQFIKFVTSLVLKSQKAMQEIQIEWKILHYYYTWNL